MSQWRHEYGYPQHLKIDFLKFVLNTRIQGYKKNNTKQSKTKQNKTKQKTKTKQKQKQNKKQTKNKTKKQNKTKQNKQKTRLLLAFRRRTV